MGFSSGQTTGSWADSGFSYSAGTSSILSIYSASSFGTHHIFFPPRFQVVLLEQKTNTFSSDLPCQLALLGFLGHQPYRPTRLAGRRLSTNHGDDALLLRFFNSGSRTRSWTIIEGRHQPLFGIASANPPHPLSAQVHTAGYCGWGLAGIQESQALGSLDDSHSLYSAPQQLLALSLI